MSKLTETQQKQLDYILDYFDFDKVAKFVMSCKCSEYSYVNPGDSKLVVTGVLRRAARKLISDFMTDPFYLEHKSIGTGGFFITRCGDGPEFEYDLSFEIENWHSDGWDEE